MSIAIFLLCYTDVSLGAGNKSVIEQHEKFPMVNMRIRIPKDLNSMIDLLCHLIQGRFAVAPLNASGIVRGMTAIGLSLTLCGCIGSRPEEAICPVIAAPVIKKPDLSERPAFLRQHLESADTVNVLLLSGGGAWGAYGAGFLNGWSARPDGMKRPRFDVVTGVSTGAIIAPFALLGPSYDQILLQAFRGLDDKGIYQRRSFLTLPFWNSFATPDRMEARLKENLTNGIIAELAQAARSGRGALVGSVNADTGKFVEFDLTALAADLPGDAARTAITDRIMAASAVPAVFPPRFVDQCMFVDGGVRESLFISGISSALAGDTKRPTRSARQVTIYAIINGPVTQPLEITRNSLTDIAMRALDLAFHQVQIASLREVYDYAKQHNFAFNWTSGDDVAPMNKPPRPDQCIAPKDPRSTFDAAFTTCLFDGAMLKATTSPSLWRTDRP